MHLSVESMQAAVADRGRPGLRLCPTCGCDGAEDLLQAPDRFHGRTELYRLVRCPACSLVWLQDPPPPAEMSNHYGPDYDRAIARGGADPDHWRERCNTVLQHKSEGSILDLGCSSGGFLASMQSSSWKLFGIEMSDVVAKQAETSCGAHVFIGEILDAPFTPASFDVITCFHVFEHLYQPREVLAKVSEWLKPGGIFYTMMPNIDSAGAHTFRSYWYALELPRHLYHFSPVSLRKVATSVGLEEVSLTTNREVFIETSVRYIFDDAISRLGFRRAPLSQAKDASILWKVVRKIFRVTILPVLAGLASFAGAGESIHAIFRKAERRT